MQSSWKEEFAENPFCQCLLTFVVQHPYAVIGFGLRNNIFGGYWQGSRTEKKLFLATIILVSFNTFIFLLKFRISFLFYK